MRIKVTALFRDRDNLQALHHPGEVLEVDDERGKNIITLGLGEWLEPQPIGVEVKDEPSGEAPAAPSGTEAEEKPEAAESEASQTGESPAKEPKSKSKRSRKSE